MLRQALFYTLILFSFLGSSVPGIAQKNDDCIHNRKKTAKNQNKAEFENIFKQELNRQEKPEPAGTIAPTSDVLPGNLFSLTGAYRDSIVAIGISDPFMEADAAKELAIHRATLSFVILKNSSVSHVMDFYTQNANGQNHSRLEEFGEIHAETDLEDFHLNVLNTYRNNFKETVVLISFNQTNNHQSGRTEDHQNTAFKATFYRRADLISRGHQVMSRINYEGISENLQGKNRKTTYSLIADGKPKNHTTTMSGTTLKPGPLYLKYKLKNATSNNQNPNEEFTSCSLKNGLWAAYITILMNGMFFETGKLRSVLKDVGERYQSSVRNLRRNIYKNTPTFSVHQIIIQDNKMAIDLKIDNTSQKTEK